MTVLPEHVVAEAEKILTAARKKKLKIVTAESCTGGLISALFTEVPGSSSVFDRGFVTYSNEAKMENIGVPSDLIEGHGAVSEEVSRAMAAGALIHSSADISISVTGIAGPGGGSSGRPVGTVHMACGWNIPNDQVDLQHEEHHFGDVGRSLVRLKSVEAALNLLKKCLGKL